MSNKPICLICGKKIKNKHPRVSWFNLDKLDNVKTRGSMHARWNDCEARQ